MRISLIVSTYNRPDALDLVLDGLAAQRYGPCLKRADVEVIVADDGSGPETVERVHAWQSGFPVALRHVWHEDTGFRLAAIRNRATAQASGEYLVFIDGDCVPFPDFLEQHARLAEAGFFVAGNRLLLAQEFTQALLEKSSDHQLLTWGWRRWWQHYRLGHINKPAALLRLPDGPHRKLRSKNWKMLKGCNIGVWKQDLALINGFDEAFSGWGYEDSDFAIRLLRAGKRIKDGRFAVPLLHLWHRENDRSQEPENLKRLQAILESDRTRAQQGLDRYPEDR